MPQTKYLNIRINLDLHLRLHIQAHNEDGAVSKLIKNHLNKNRN